MHYQLFHGESIIFSSLQICFSIGYEINYILYEVLSLVVEFCFVSYTKLAPFAIDDNTVMVDFFFFFFTEKQEKEIDIYANLSDEKAFVFSVALAEINRKILGQRLIL